MTVDEKINLIDSFDDVDEFTAYHLEILLELSFDENDYVRSQCAAQFVNFKNDISLKMLFQLATDSSPLVRTEAHDSLSVFDNIEAEKFLYNAIFSEKENLARSYAILSWIDIIINLSLVSNGKIDVLYTLERREESDECILSISYGLYLFGEKCYINKILAFLHHENYHLRCSAINVLSNISNSENKNEIINALSHMLLSENSSAVVGKAKHVLNELQL